MRTEGTLRHWNDERGFGFIVATETKQDVFVHISALPQTGRRPQPGERLAFSIETGHDGKKRAISVSYLDPPTAASLAARNATHSASSPARARDTARPPSRHRGPHGHEHARPGQRRFGGVLTLLALCGIGAAIMGSEAFRGLLPSSTPTTGDAAASVPSTAVSSTAVPSTAVSSTTAPTTASSAAAPASTTTATPAFRCDGRTHCSQMTSCAEARDFLRHCPGAEMDGNGDGEPCEQQWCH
jgi:cold shock CspA family protein